MKKVLLFSVLLCTGLYACSNMDEVEPQAEEVVQLTSRANSAYAAELAENWQNMTQIQRVW